METKPFFFTSEFYAAVVLPWLVTALQNTDTINAVPEKWRWVLPIAASLASGLYAMGRGQAKSGVAPTSKSPGVK